MAKRSKKRKTEGVSISGKEAAVLSLRPRAHPDWVWALLLVLVGLATYAPVWHAGYVWDDDMLVTNNACVIGPLGLKEIWTTSAADICPLTITTFWLIHALFGLDPLPYHLVTVFMHLATGVVLWRVLLGLKIPGAWFGAALWALHPVGVESVAWISELKNTQSALFFLLSILFYLKWRQAGTGWNYALVLIFAALAMTSKSSTVILPVVLCLCAWWMDARWQWRNVTRVAPVFLMSIVDGLISIANLGYQAATTPDPQWVRTWPERLAVSGDAVWFYLSKLIWPYPLIAIYPRWQINTGLAISYLPLLAVIIVLLFLWIYRGTWARPWFFVFAYYIVALLPGLGFIDNVIFRYSLVFDHFQYLASMGPLALAGAGLTRLGDITIAGEERLRRIICAGILLVLATLSSQRASTYESADTLWTYTLAHNPDSWMARNNLGKAQAQDGQVDDAVDNFQNALKINPNDANAHSNLGIALIHEGRVDEGIEQFRSAITIEPRLPVPHYNLGIALYSQGKISEAVEQLTEAVKLNPHNLEMQQALAKAKAKAAPTAP